MSQRRLGIDVARILALLLVVAGHLLLAVIDRPGGEVRGANLLALWPGWAWLAALAPMPVFFAAGGWANATAELRTTAPRLRALVGLGAVAVGTWSLAVAIAWGATGEAGIVGDGARIATQPLWFLAAYVPFAAGGGRLARAAARRPALCIAGCLAGLAVLDLARFELGAPQWVGWPGFFLAWGVPWLLGGWWRQRWADSIAATGDAGRTARGQAGAGRLGERRCGSVLLAGAGLTGVALVGRLGYSPALIDAVPGQRSNTTPPTLYTGVAGIAQVGGLMLAARGLDRLGQRWSRLWSRAGEMAVGVYVWHLTALALAAALLAAGLATPPRLTGWWWASRPIWWAAVGAITAALVGLTAVARSGLTRHTANRRSEAVETAALGVGVVLAMLGAALIGLQGPRTVPLAVICTGLLAAAWYLLASPPRESART